MLRAMKVFGGVLVFRGVATAHVAAFHAQAQVHPRITALEALLTAALVCRGELDLIQMRTSHF
jgi:hypothetical protein